MNNKTLHIIWSHIPVHEFDLFFILTWMTSDNWPVIETLAGLFLSPSLGEALPRAVWTTSSGGVGALGGGGGGGGFTSLGELDVI